MGRKNWIFILIALLIFFVQCSSVSASPAARIVSGVVTNVVSTVFKWLWSMNSTSKTAVSTRSMVKFEDGYNVETVFDGSKLGIEPYSVEVSAAGDILVLDSENSNIYKISTLFSYSRPKLVAGSAEGYTGHVDGKLREARMNHPKGLTVDDNGNVYVADTMNMAIRKISDTGVVTIAGGKLNRGGGHIDGPSEDAKFSNDFDLVYVKSSCSLLVIDRGNQAIREIQLHEDDCSQKYDDNLHLGAAVLAAACFFGYLLAFLQRKIAALFSFDKDPKTYSRSMPHAQYQTHPPKSIRPPLIPSEDEYKKQEDGLFSSIGRLFLITGSSFLEIFGGLFSGPKKKPISKNGNSWPLQESFVIPHEDSPPPIEAREPTPRKNYPFKAGPYNQGPPYYGDFRGPPMGHVQQLQHHQHYQTHSPLGPETYYEQQSGETNEIVFGAVQEQDGPREAMVIKAVDYGDSAYSSYNVRSRYNYMSYSYGY
ncbi:hypothetical protein ACJIZ3_007911 [Penstemon smallii]|uniref:NHL repeat-containing protein n=1 Tax=Penstemon smallii TaxID=265156 RepID=A0ABD3T8Z7_9LAMI